MTVVKNIRDSFLLMAIFFSIGLAVYPVSEATATFVNSGLVFAASMIIGGITDLVNKPKEESKD